MADGRNTFPLSSHDLAVEVLTAMEQDCGPICAEPYASWAKQLAAAYLELETPSTLEKRRAA